MQGDESEEKHETETERITRHPQVEAKLRVKDPRRVAAGKALGESNKRAREAFKARDGSIAGSIAKGWERKPRDGAGWFGRESHKAPALRGTGGLDSLFGPPDGNFHRGNWHHRLSNV